MQSFDTLEDDADFRSHVLWCEELGDFGRGLFFREALVDGLDPVLLFFEWLLQLGLAVEVDLFDEGLVAPLTVQFDGGLEATKSPMRAMSMP